MAKKIVILFVLLSLCSFPAHANDTHKNSSKWRTILTIVGVGGGFTAGMFVGISAYDDAINSERKVWTTAALMSAAGGVGGFLLGRHIDKSREYKESSIMPEIQWKTVPQVPNSDALPTSGLLRDSDPIELLSRK